MTPGQIERLAEEAASSQVCHSSGISGAVAVVAVGKK
jgi:hypothetical protein